MILLYAPEETGFADNGLGALPDAVSCEVTEERNGLFELTMQYPITGLHYDEIKNRCFIMAKPNPTDNSQPFRVYQITRPLNGIVTVYAAHISYDLSGIVLSPFTASSAAQAMAEIPAHSSTENPFTFWTDKGTTAEFSVSVPSSVRSIMGGSTGSLLDVYGGEYAYDRYTVRLYNQRGQDNGVTIRYGKNLTDLIQEENIQNVYTGVYPYWSAQEDYLELPEKVVYAEGTYSFTRILALDLSGEFEEKPTEEQLREQAQTYMENNRIGVPSVSLTVSFVQLEQTEEYKNTALLERVSLCDAVSVQFPQLGVQASAKCVKTVYDVLNDRYTSVELGDAKVNIADTIAGQQQDIGKAPTTSAMQQAISNATGLITGNKGGYVVLHSSTGAQTPDEILVMDAPDIATAAKVWRWNKSGLGYSGNGYNGPYALAMTADGSIVADFITTGVLTANLIRAGVLQSINGVTSLNMESGLLTFHTSFPDGDTGRIEVWSNGLTFWKNNEHMGSFYTSDAGEGIVKANQIILSDNDQASDYGRMYLRSDGKTEVQANYVGALDGFLLGGVGLELKTVTIDGTTITYLGR